MSAGPRTLTVALGERGYPVFIGPGVLRDRERFDRVLPGGPLLVVSNETVAPLYMDSLRETLSHRNVKQLVLPDGEEHKVLASFERIVSALARAGVTRDGAVLALGGGVVGDLAGFAAACYMRGIGFINCPTTLLAQVDASVGGKTGVNLPAGKNLVGAFHQPVGVFADTDTLATLADREYRAGLAEVVKAALIRDAAFFEWLEANAGDLLRRRADAVTEAIERACRIKADIVAADERERGVRALLNLGHTFAHALEAETGYGQLLHGEAVAMGLALAAELSVRETSLAASEAERIRRLLARLGLGTRLPAGLEPGRLVERMRLDKKVRGGRLRLVLLECLGRALVSADVGEAAVLDLLARPG